MRSTPESTPAACAFSGQPFEVRNKRVVLTSESLDEEVRVAWLASDPERDQLHIRQVPCVATQERQVVGPGLEHDYVPGLTDELGEILTDVADVPADLGDQISLPDDPWKSHGGRLAPATMEPISLVPKAVQPQRMPGVVVANRHFARIHARKDRQEDPPHPDDAGQAFPTPTIPTSEYVDARG